MIMNVHNIICRESGQMCYNQRHPLPSLSSSSKPHVPQQSRVLNEVVRRMKYRVYVHDITTMSAYRRDGHPSVFKRVMHEEEKHHRIAAGPSSDCSHWCLPGVPDIWNEMLSSIILTNVVVWGFIYESVFTQSWTIVLFVLSSEWFSLFIYVSQLTNNPISNDKTTQTCSFHSLGIIINVFWLNPIPT